MASEVLTIGVLALQGDFQAHADALQRAAASGRIAPASTSVSSSASQSGFRLELRFVRTPEQLEGLSGLVLPGGESTVILRLLDEGFRRLLREKISAGLPVLATCAGVILIAKRVTHPEQSSLGLLDIDVMRNAYGRQVDSFIASTGENSELRWTADGIFELNPSKARSDTCPTIDEPSETQAVFIRAPQITRTGPRVKVLLMHRENPVLVQQENIIAGTFHPELSNSSQNTVSNIFLSTVLAKLDRS